VVFLLDPRIDVVSEVNGMLDGRRLRYILVLSMASQSISWQTRHVGWTDIVTVIRLPAYGQ